MKFFNNFNYLILFRRICMVGLLAVGCVIGVLTYRLELDFRDGEVLGKVLKAVSDPRPATRPVHEAIDSRDCQCRRRWNTCPCGSDISIPSRGEDYYNALTDTVRDRRYEDFPAALRAATGYENIKTAAGAQQGTAVRVSRERSYGAGTLQEVFLDYAVPAHRVRALFAQNPDKPKGLFILTLGSWATPEHLLDLRDDGDYHRDIGRYYFDRGYDVAVFDHGTNGSVESLLNVDAILQGTQILGLWARSVCDFLDDSNLRDRYQDIYLYGLSRGGRVVEYTAALCPGFTFAIVGDLFYPDSYDEYFWNSISTSDYLKFGAWFPHLKPIAGHHSMIDFLNASQSPIIYTTARENVENAIPALGDKFDLAGPLTKHDHRRLVFKSDIGHTPELELIDMMLAGAWREVPGVRLEPNRN